MENKVERIIDIRLNNTSQLAGFAKADDLKYLLKAVANIEYIYSPEMAPTQEILDAYKKNKGDWKEYEKEFHELIIKRQIENLEVTKKLNNCCLLCSEDQPVNCHRRLVAEYLCLKLGNITIKHLY
jgi:uncharacterized protein (DUF488 family)